VKKHRRGKSVQKLNARNFIQRFYRLEWEKSTNHMFQIVGTDTKIRGIQFYLIEAHSFFKTNVISPENETLKSALLHWKDRISKAIHICYQPDSDIILTSAAYISFDPPRKYVRLKKSVRKKKKEIWTSFPLTNKNCCRSMATS